MAGVGALWRWLWGRRLPLAVYLFCQAGFLLWWVALYPGLMSRDSIRYVQHVTSIPWQAMHSVLYDTFVLISLRLTGDLGALTLAQTTAMAAVIAWLVAALRALGVPAWALAVAGCAIPLLPPLGSFTVTIWKDIPFTIVAIAITATIARLLALPERSGGAANRLLAALGFELLLLTLFRSNALVIVPVIVIILILVLRGMRVRLAVTGAAALAGWVLAVTVAYPAVGIERNSPSHQYSTAYADIAYAFVQAPSTFTVADRALMTQVAPLDVWKRGGSTCYNVNRLLYNSGFSWREGDRRSGELLDLWLRVIKRTPVLAVKTWLCRGSVAWNVLSGPGTLGGGTYKYEKSTPLVVDGVLKSDPKLAASPYASALSIRPLSYRLHRTAMTLLVKSTAPSWEWLLWRGATWCYICYLAVIAFTAATRRPALLALTAMVAGQQLGVLAVIAAQDARYMMPAIFIGILFLPLVIAAATRSRRAEDPADVPS